MKLSVCFLSFILSLNTLIHSFDTAGHVHFLQNGNLRPDSSSRLRARARVNLAGPEAARGGAGGAGFGARPRELFSGCEACSIFSSGVGSRSSISGGVMGEEVGLNLTLSRLFFLVGLVDDE